MRKIFTIVLLLSLSFQSLVKLGIITWYEVNKSYVARTLCENRDKPERKCQGKCYLKKQLAKTDANDEDDARSNGTPKYSVHMEPVDFIIAGSIAISRFPGTTDRTMNGRYSFPAGLPALSDIFHPPAGTC